MFHLILGHGNALLAGSISEWVTVRHMRGCTAGAGWGHAGARRGGREMPFVYMSRAAGADFALVGHAPPICDAKKWMARVQGRLQTSASALPGEQGERTGKYTSSRII